MNQPKPPPFDLRALVRKVADKAGTPDPGVVAEVLAEIKDADLRAALGKTLRDYVRTTLQTPALALAEPAEEKAAPSANRSAKVAAIRATWRRHLKDPVHVGDGKWKFWEDCTAADFYASADEHMVMAKHTAAAGDRRRAAGDLLTEHHVTKWSELPADVQEKAFTQLGIAA